MRWLASLSLSRAVGFALLWPVILVAAPFLFIAVVSFYTEFRSRIAGAGSSTLGWAIPVARSTLLWLVLPPTLFLCAWWIVRHGYLDPRSRLE